MSEKESEEQLALANVLSKILLSNSDLNEIGRSLAFQLKQLMNINWAAIGLIEKTKGMVRLFPLSPKISSDWELGDTISLDGSPIAWLYQNKRALMEPDLAKESQFWTGAFWLKNRIRTIVYLPLFSGGEVFGGLIFASHRIKAYRKRELKLLKYATAQITAPIWHANLLAPIIEEQHNNHKLEERFLRLEQALKKSTSFIETWGQDLRSRTSAIKHANEPFPQIKNSVYPRVQIEVQMAGIIKVFIVDEKVFSRRGLSLYFSQTEDIKVIGECDYFLEDTVSMVGELAPDVVLMDVNLPSLSGLDLARRIAHRLPNISVILLAPYEDDGQIFEALKAGVAGYLTSNTTFEGLANSIRRVAEGNRIINHLLVRPEVARRVLNQLQDIVGVAKQFDPLLSLQEKEILGYFVRGYSITKVTHAMGTSEAEITNQMANIASKLIANFRIYPKLKW